MPNLQSAKKALRQSVKRQARNKTYKNKIKNIFKEMNSLVGEGKQQDAALMLPAFYKAVDKAAKRHLLHKNTAARRKALMAKRTAAKADRK